MNRNIFVLIFGSTFGNLGSSLFRLTVGFLVWELSKSGALVAAVAVAEVVPNIIFSPIAGALADRIELKKSSYLISFLLACLSFAVAIVVYREPDAMTIFILILAVFLSSLLGSFSRAVHQKLLGFAFNKAEIKKALSVNSVCFNTSKFVAPLIAALFFIGANYQLSFLFNALSYLCVALTTYLFVYDRPPKSMPSQNKSIVSDIKDSLSYIYANGDLRFLFVLVIAGTIFARSIYDVLPMITEYLLNRESSDFLYVSTSLGGFALCAGLISSFMPRHAGLRTIAKYTSTALLLIFMNLFVESFIVSVILLGISSFCFVSSGLNTVTYIHQNVPESLKGKVISFYYLALLGGGSLGAILYGLMFELNIGNALWFLPLLGLLALASYPRSHRVIS